jgi:hypothetical protein
MRSVVDLGLANFEIKLDILYKPLPFRGKTDSNNANYYYNEKRMIAIAVGALLFNCSRNRRLNNNERKRYGLST